jgi:hypothetical protein
MNRRQFLGASLMTTIASAALPWDSFLEWFRKWFGEVKRKAETTLTTFAAFLKERYADSDLLRSFNESRPLFALIPKEQTFAS